jgi:tRNA pseudouridine38-40 synthase
MRDYAGFTDKRIEKDTSTLVLVQEAAIVEAGDLILVRLRASHFLWKMVRRIVGCLVGVGRGEISVKDFEGLFAAPSPYPARVTAPPSGLFLEEVIFQGEEFRRPLEPVLGVSSSREIPLAPASPTVTSNLPLRAKHHVSPENAARRPSRSRKG